MLTFVLLSCVATWSSPSYPGASVGAAPSLGARPGPQSSELPLESASRVLDATRRGSDAWGFSQCEYQRMNLTGEWDSTAGDDSAHFVTAGAGSHSVVFFERDGTQLEIQLPIGADVTMDDAFWHVHANGKAISGAGYLPVSVPIADAFTRHCLQYTSLKNYSLTGSCWDGGVVDAATHCTVYTCGSGTDNCKLTWTYTQEEGGQSGENTSLCGTGHAYECATNICWDFGAGP